MNYDSRESTLKHIRRVKELIDVFISGLRERARLHDASKLYSPEKELFDLYRPRLASLKYGSDEYKSSLVSLAPALDHHYEHNRHHPEHHGHGVNDMTLVDLIEMLCDWKTAGEEQDSGSIVQSLEVNEVRFGLSPQLARILRNTAMEAGWL